MTRVARSTSSQRRAPAGGALPLVAVLLAVAATGPAVRSAAAAAPTPPAAAPTPTPSPTAALAYARVGRGPAVVLLHGLGGDRSVWSDVVAHLAPTHSVVTVDLPGHGASPAPSTIDFDAIARQVADLVRKERLDRPVLVGHSMGGAVAARVPLVAPGLLRGLVLVDAFLAPLPVSDRERAGFAAGYAHDPAGTLAGFFAAAAQPGAQLDRIVAAGKRLPGATWLGYFDFAARHGVDGPTLALPVLLCAGPLLVGTAPVDEKAHLAAAGYAAVPSLSVERFPRSRHWLFWDEPAHFTAALDAFLLR